MSVTPEELQIICNTTIKLVEIKQNECKHLCVENMAAITFGNLLGELSAHKEGRASLFIDDSARLTHKES